VIPGSASGHGVRFAAVVLRAKGVSVEALLQHAGLDPGVLQDPDSRVPPRSVVAFLEEAVRQTGDERLGLHMGEAVRPAALDALGYVFRTSATVGDGLQRLAEYYRFLSDVLGLRVVREGRRVRLVAITSSPSFICRPLTEFRLSAIAQEIRLETGDPGLHPLAVEFAYAPVPAAEHRRFFQCPVRFSCAANALLYPVEVLDRPFRGAEPELREVLERRVRDVIARLPPRHGSIADGAGAVVGQRLARGRPSATSVARSLGLSERSLRRALSAEGTSLREILERVRREQAERYLRAGLPSSEIAFLLGFSDPSAFHRSFKQWTGQTPRAYRAAHGP
jgi:AraC-like DNA-binding protein